MPTSEWRRWHICGKITLKGAREMTNRKIPNENSLENDKGGNDTIDPNLIKEWREASEALGMGN